MKRGAIILCGGRSSRMGGDKALMPFGDETMLERVVRVISTVVEPSCITMVAAKKQLLPKLGPAVRIVRDTVEFSGPLIAISEVAKELPQTDAIFVAGCDTPLLKPEVIEFLFAHLEGHDAVVPEDAERMYPLCGVYRAEVFKCGPKMRSLKEFITQLDAKRITTELLRDIDPELQSLRNVNTHQDYLDALAVAGFSTP